MAGVVVQHRVHRSSVLVLVPILSKPIRGLLRDCPVCHIIHPVKTIHLSLSPTGSAVVSSGVLEDLKAAGMPDLDVVGHTPTPPALIIGHKATPRAVQDHKAYAQRHWRAHAVGA